MAEEPEKQEEQQEPVEQPEEEFKYDSEMDEVLAKLDNYIYSKQDAAKKEDTDDVWQQYEPEIEQAERTYDRDVSEIAKITKKTAEKVRNLEAEQRSSEIYAKFMENANDVERRLAKKMLKAKMDPRDMRDRINMIRSEAEQITAEYESVRRKALEDAEKEALETIAGGAIRPTRVRTSAEEVETYRERYLQTGNTSYLEEVAKSILCPWLNNKPKKCDSCNKETDELYCTPIGTGNWRCKECHMALCDAIYGDETLEEALKHSTDWPDSYPAIIPEYYNKHKDKKVIPYKSNMVMKSNDRR